MPDPGEHFLPPVGFFWTVLPAACRTEGHDSGPSGHNDFEPRAGSRTKPLFDVAEFLGGASTGMRQNRMQGLCILAPADPLARR
ncbi:hypothetical protein BH24PSE2_BH24PSE2_10620 [soil metagenome]